MKIYKIMSDIPKLDTLILLSPIPTSVRRIARWHRTLKWSLICHFLISPKICTLIQLVMVFLYFFLFLYAAC